MKYSPMHIFCLLASAAVIYGVLLLAGLGGLGLGAVAMLRPGK